MTHHIRVAGIDLLCRVEFDLQKLDALARRAANARGGKASAGPITVHITHKKSERKT